MTKQEADNLIDKSYELFLNVSELVLDSVSYIELQNELSVWLRMDREKYGNIEIYRNIKLFELLDSHGRIYIELK